MERWKRCWREGIAPVLSRCHLQALRAALEVDDPRIIQEATTEPAYDRGTALWPVAAACPLAFCGWQGNELTAVREVEEWFGAVCDAIDRKMHAAGGCNWFLSWIDETRRDIWRPALLAEVIRSLEALEEEPCP